MTAVDGTPTRKLGRLPAPVGLGVYVRRHVEQWDAAECARSASRYLAARVRRVSLMVEAVQGRPVGTDALARAAECYREHGIGVELWTFPHPTQRPSQAVLEALADARTATGASTCTLDVEAFEQQAPTAQWVRELIDGARGLFGHVAVTSYPVPAWHRTMPWDAMLSADSGSPQLYESALIADRVRRSFAAWGRLPLVPSLPAYDVGAGLNAETQLLAALDAVCLDPVTRRPRVSGATLWSDPQIDARERRVLADWADRHGW